MQSNDDDGGKTNMAGKGNFTQALRELTGFDETPEKDRPQAETNRTEEYQSYFQTQQINTETTHVHVEAEAVSAERSPDSHVTSTMVIKGKVRSEGNIFVEGSVYGNIATAGNIAVKNIVFGDIKANNVSLTNARVKGNIRCEQQAAVGNQTIVVGDVNANTIIVSGKIKGDLQAADTTVLEEEAVVSGNIVTGNILSNSGASLKGSVTTTGNAEVDEDAEFDLGVEAYE